jgi:hypothetical protein
VAYAGRWRSRCCWPADPPTLLGQLSQAGPGTRRIVTVTKYEYESPSPETHLGASVCRRQLNTDGGGQVDRLPVTDFFTQGRKIWAICPCHAAMCVRIGSLGLRPFPLTHSAMPNKRRPTRLALGRLTDPMGGYVPTPGASADRPEQLDRLPMHRVQVLRP